MDREQAFDLRDYLRILKRRRWLILGTIAAVLVTTGLLTWRQTPIYQGVARVEVQPATLGSFETVRLLEALVDPRFLLQTQVELAQSPAVLDIAARNIGLASSRELTGSVAVNLVTDSQIIEIRAAHPSAGEARRRANAVARAYIDYRRTRAEDQLLDTTKDLTRQILQAQGRIRELDAKGFEGEGGQARLTEKESLFTRLAALEAQRQAVPDPSAARRGGGTIVQEAELPRAPVSPRKSLNMFLALVIGGMLGAGLAFLAENLDDRFRGPEDVERRIGAPVVGHVPYIERWADEPDLPLVTLNGADTGAAEAYRTLRTNLKFIQMTEPVSTIAVTSGVAGEGKTTTAANLAVAFAQAGTRTILLSADMRRPTLHKVFHLPDSGGMLDALDPAHPITDSLRPAGVPNLKLLTAGGTPPNPTEILGSVRFMKLLETLGAASDLVIIDTPPVLGIADTGALAPRVDGVVLVIDTRTASRRQVVHAAELLRRAGGRILGVLMNAVEADEDHGYYYQFYSSYYTQDLPSTRAEVEETSS